MKKIVLCLSLMWLLVLVGCGSSMTVVEYNDSFVDIVKECTDSTQVLFDIYQTDASLEDINNALNDSIATCQKAENSASKLWDFDNDSALKDAVVSLLSTDVKYLETFSKTSPYWNRDDISEEDRTNYKALKNELFDMESDLNNQFSSLQEAQKIFAGKHWLKLE